MAKKKSAASKSSAQISAKKKPRGKPFAPDNPYKFRSKAENGGAVDARINAGGRPKLLGESYRAWLEKVNAEGLTNAEAVAMAMGLQAMKGDVGAAREMRAATEGDKHVVETWQDRVVRLLREHKVTPAEVVEELGQDVATDLLITAGLSGGEGGQTGTEGGGAGDTDQPLDVAQPGPAEPTAA